jgi:cobalt/nickel transport system permease protein
VSCHAAQELDQHGAGAGPVHRLDALVKLLATLAFVVTLVSFPKHAVAPLVPFAAFPLLLGALGRVPWRPLLRLQLAGLPFVLLAGGFNVVADPARVPLAPGLELRAGWLSFTAILLKYALASGAVLVLMATTSFPRLLQALNRLHVPRPFTLLLQFLYRYLFVLVEESRALRRAHALRAPRRRLPDLHTAPILLGHLFLRTWERAERVYRSMCLRGYDGIVPVAAPTRLGGRDLLFLAGVGAACAAGRALPLMPWFGAWLLGSLT